MCECEHFVNLLNEYPVFLPTINSAINNMDCMYQCEFYQINVCVFLSNFEKKKPFSMFHDYF